MLHYGQHHRNSLGVLREVDRVGYDMRHLVERYAAIPLGIDNFAAKVYDGIRKLHFAVSQL